MLLLPTCARSAVCRNTSMLTMPRRMFLPGHVLSNRLSSISMCRSHSRAGDQKYCSTSGVREAGSLFTYVRVREQSASLGTQRLFHHTGRMQSRM